MNSVKDYIESTRALQQKFEEVRRGFISRRKTFEEQYQPITERLQDLGDRIEKKSTLTTTTTPQEVLGNVAFNYLYTTPPSDRDTTFGLKIDGGKIYLGSEQVFINRDVITVKGESFQGTEGLWRLLTLKDPTDFTENDLKIYEHLILITNAHRHKNDPNSRIKSNSGNKYKKIIKGMLVTGKREIKGSGLEKIVTNAPIEYVYWNSLDELLNRLYIVYGEIKAGNTNPTLVNEIISILQEIREI